MKATWDRSCQETETDFIAATRYAFSSNLTALSAVDEGRNHGRGLAAEDKQACCHWPVKKLMVRRLAPAGTYDGAKGASQAGICQMLHAFLNASRGLPAILETAEL